MAGVSPEQREQVLALLRAGQLSREQIAENADVSPGTVSAIKAHITMGSYDVSAGAETEELIDASETTLGLERDMQRSLRANLEQLEPLLRITDDGKERSTEAGRIDITAVDGDGATVVIELKSGVAAPEALTQLLAYMGALAETGEKARGILIASDFHPRVRFAARVVPNVSLRRYRVKFAFEPVE